MRKNTLILGIILFVFGVIMWQMGADNLYKAQIFGMLGHNSAQIAFWGLFTFIGFILFIVGIIVSIVGIALKEKNSIYQPNPQHQMSYYQQHNQQPIQQQLRYCQSCGRSIPMDANICPYCTKSPNQSKINPNNKYCPECGKQLPFNTKFCPHCGTKL